MSVRPAAVAGRFYPREPETLARRLEELLREADANTDPSPPTPPPKALIVPHAGYVFSGAVAAAAYRRIRRLRDRIRRVVLMGPVHHVPVRGMAVSSADAFATPLGEVPVDRRSVDALVQGFPSVSINDECHQNEHSLEVHLPFLQTVLERFEVVPVAVGDASPRDVEIVLDHLWGGDETLLVISSDLSHYRDFDTACRLDRDTCRAIEQLQPRSIGRGKACGGIPIRGLLRLARKMNLMPRTVDLRNSGHTAGARNRVVGYGSWLFHPLEPEARLGVQQRAALTGIARRSIEHGLRRNAPLPIDESKVGPQLRRPHASFVTLQREGRLRGCVGSLQPTQPLARDVALNAFRAAFEDKRFAPLRPRELPELDVHLSVLRPPEPVAAASEEELIGKLRPWVDGVILADGEHRATFLPSVWREFGDAREFLARLKRKAGLAPDHWTDSLRVSRYTTETW